MFYRLAIVMTLMLVYSSSASAYVGPGLIVMGNIFGPLLIFIPFVLLLLFFAVRWWFKKMRRNLMVKKDNQDDVKSDDDKNSAD